ncbi:hypothetical protein [Inhella gelatinilytica]|uniref:Uncharacterized protein n=1 Tax=Inhella gelatinilytica TaxID=2795030 RepID=A0A931IY56_9BURK|nr:hypothetical protein [Inhella gelatinilytica]MBH9553214.1 hypothetical protein [Inhella gelatinilytica]
MLVLTGCGALRSPTIATIATVQAAPPGCEMTIEGYFPDMAHDPIGLIFSGRSKITAKVLLPSLAGTIDGRLVKVQYQGERGEPWGGNTKLKGTVVFQSNQVRISLSHIVSEQLSDPMLFNGSYTLIGATTCSDRL